MTNDLSVRRPLDGRADFRAAVRALLMALPEGPAREAWLIDEDLADWPLGEPELLQALARWLRQPGSRLHLIARGFDGVAAAAPRLAVWRRDWIHAIDCLSPHDGEVSSLPCMMVVPPVCLEVFDRARWRGTLSPEPAVLRQGMEKVEAISQRSGPAWPLRVLGI